MHRFPVLIERFEYRDPTGRTGCCRIEILLAKSRLVVIATELEDNPGMSITNAAEFVATQVCRQFQIDPSRLIWIEHYGYPAPSSPRRPRTYDRITFGRIDPKAELCFGEPQWRSLSDRDWRDLGLEPRPPAP